MGLIEHSIIDLVIISTTLLGRFPLDFGVWIHKSISKALVLGCRGHLRFSRCSDLLIYLFYFSRLVPVLTYTNAELKQLEQEVEQCCLSVYSQRKNLEKP